MSDLIRPFDLFDDFHRPLGSWLGRDLPFRGTTGSDAWLPPIDIRQADGEFIIEVEVPGFTADQVDVEVHDGVLSIRGERSTDSETEEEGVIRRERRRGQFLRRFTLPGGASADEIAANVKDGVLTVKIPQVSQADVKRVEVS